MQADRYPLKMEKHSHGQLVAWNAREEAAYEGMGWIPRPDTPPEYEAFPCWLRHPDDGKPDRLVSDGEEARQAAMEGYVLPSDTQIAAGEQAFAAAYTVKVEGYEPVRYPLMLRHPEHQDAVPLSWRYEPGPGGIARGVPIPGEPERFPDVEVRSAEEEMEWTKRGWPIGSQFAQRAAVAHETPDPTKTPREDEDRSHAPPLVASTPRKKLSGAARRKLARLGQEMPA